MPEIAILSKAIKEKPKRIRYLKSKGDKRISYKKDGSIDILKSVILFAITPELPIGFKVCKVCNNLKHKSEFRGGRITCKHCESEKIKEAYRHKRLKEVNIYWPDHKPGICVYCGATHKEKKFSFEHGQYRKVCNECRWKREKENHTDIYYKKRNKKERTDPKTRINKLMRNGIGKDLKSRNSSKNKKSWAYLVGYSVEELEKHLRKSLKKLNKEKGLSYTWGDFLKAKLHIDHIIPIVSFNYDSADHPDFKRCWALENLQLLPASDNISKGGKYESFQTAF